VRGLVETITAREPGVAVIVLGDLNDFEDTQPLAAATDGDVLVDLHQRVAPDEDYTYIFNGVSQILDYILVPPTLLGRVTEVGPVHVNADFGHPPPAGVTDWRDRGGQPSPAASDHDPLLLRLSLEGSQPPPRRIHLPVALAEAPVGAGGDPEPAPPTPTSRPGPEPTATVPAGGPPRSPIRIDAVFYDGDVPRVESDEYVEITNVTSADVDLTGWRLVSVQGNQEYGFPDGFSMAGGQTCRVYTDEVHPEHCGLSWAWSSSGIWRNSGDKAELRDAAGGLVDWFCFGSYEGQCG
jgi:hypothetical protein